MASSSSGADFFGNCSHCSKIDMKMFNCPALAGRAQHDYPNYNLPGLPMHPQFLSRSANHCCSTTHPPVYPSFPIRLNSFCNCSRCRTTNVDRQLAMTPRTGVNSCWVSPVEIHNTNLNTNFIQNPLQSQPLPPRRVRMTNISPMDGLNGMSALSYHHRHHFHHYHYHHHTQSRNNLHPYALPVFHPRIHRQTGRTSRHNGENPVPNFLPILTSEARVTWEGHLETEQLENVVSLGELIVEEKPKGISKSVLESLPTYRVASKDKNIGESRCVICLIDFELKQQVRILPCLHEYHSKCIDKWLKSNRSCPICRKEIKIS